MKKGIKIALAVVMIVSVMSLGLTGCAKEEPKVLKIGSIWPLTGPGAPWGLPWNQTYIMQADKINAAGGITVGGETYMIEIISEDTKYKPDLAVAAANKVIFEDKVKFLFGPVGSAAALAVAPISEGEGVLEFVGCWTDKLPSPDYPRIWRTSLSSTEIAPGLYAWIDETYPEVERWGLINPNDETGWALAEACKAALKVQGKTVVVEEYYERGTLDFYPVLTRMLAKDIDMLDVCGSPGGEGGLMVKQARELGFTGKMMTVTHYDAEDLAELAGVEAAEGFIAPVRSITTGPLADPTCVAFKEEFIAYWGADKWDVNAFTCADTLLWLLYAIQKADSIDPEKVRAVMDATTEWDNPLYGPTRWGGLAFYGINHQQLAKLAVIECRDGKEYPMGWIDVPEPTR